jgi:hypothetical protein
MIYALLLSLGLGFTASTQEKDPRAGFSCKGKWCDELVVKRKK